MKNGIRRWISAVLIGALSVPSFAEAPLEAEAASGSDIKIHFLNLSDEPNDAILLECNGHFGMIDAGEDNDYPDGSDPRYPLREGLPLGRDMKTKSSPTCTPQVSGSSISSSARIRTATTSALRTRLSVNSLRTVSI